MKPNRKINVRLEKNLGLPTVSIKFQEKDRTVFPLLIDTGIRHNLFDPCFFEEWIDYTPSPAMPRPENYNPLSLLYYPEPPPPAHKKLGAKRIMCKDGVRRSCEMIKLNFFIEERKHSELFAIDPSMCRYFQFKKRKVIVGVLGIDFLRKHKWILDYSEMKTNSTILKTFNYD